MKKEIAGFSFIQILISALLLTSLSVITFKIRKQQVELGKSSSYAFESLIIIDKMKTLLSHPKSCVTTLGGKMAGFSQVKSLIYKDSISNVEKVFFEESSINGPVYGDGDVLIKSMILESSDGLFSVKNGLTLFKVSFSDFASSGKRFKNFSFPVHVEVDAKGGITSCFTLEGLGAININNPVGKWQQKENQIISIKTRSVNVGQIARKSELNIKGSMRLGSEYTKCKESQYGSIRYGKNQGLLFCNKRQLWEKVHHEEPIKLTKESFVVSNNNTNEEKVSITQNKYAFCQLDKSYFTGGRCYALPVSETDYRPRWKLVADLNNGKDINCNFSCYK